MSLAYPDKKIEKVICEGATSGTDFTENIPVHDETAAGKGKFTFDTGFPPATSQPLEAGGYPPQRNDENGILRLFSKWLHWFQSGGYSKYDTTLDYVEGCTVYHNGERYWCKQANGVSSTVKVPGIDTNYWLPFTRSISVTGKAQGTGTISTGNTNINITGVTITKWDTARNISLSGDASGTTTMDGSKNVTIATTVLAANKVKHKLTINGISWDGSADKTITISEAGFVPIAGIIPYFGASLPDSNWLWCNGGTFNTSTYPTLYSRLGTNKVPNLMDNRFIEGSAVSARGTTKNPGLPNITGQIHPVFEDNYIPSPSGAFRRSGTAYEADGRSYTSENKGYAFNAGWSNSIYGNSTTVQPKSLCLPYIIRAK